MDTIRLQQLFDSYSEKYEIFNNQEHRETFKWSAVSHFQKYWDPDDEQFEEMFKTSFEDSQNQIDVPSFQPIGGVIFLCKQSSAMTENVRAAFKELLAGDDSDLKKRQKRAEKFVTDMNRMLQETAPDKWKYHQDLGSALLFLNFADPDDNYMYGESEVKAFAEYLGVKKELFKKDVLQLPNYYKLCDEVAAELMQQTDLLQQVDEALEAEADLSDDSSVTEIDGENHLLVYDLIYCAKHYDLYEEDGLAGSRGRDFSGDEENKKEERKLKTQIRSLTKKKDAYTAEREGMQFPEMNGAGVEHARYGKGLVIEQEGKYLTVDFEGRATKKFLLPDALTKGFLTTDSEEAVEVCRKIAKLDEDLLNAQREIELLNIQLNGYKEG